MLAGRSMLLLHIRGASVVCVRQQSYVREASWAQHGTESFEGNAHHNISNVTPDTALQLGADTHAWLTAGFPAELPNCRLIWIRQRVSVRHMDSDGHTVSYQLMPQTSRNDPCL
jgi:hypothetical protein